MRFQERLTDLPIEETISSVSTKGGMVGGTLYGIAGWLTSSAGAVVIGIVVTILGFVVNYIFQRKRDARETAEKELAWRYMHAEELRQQELHAAKLRALQVRNEVMSEDTN